jgi:hypothetical protein
MCRIKGTGQAKQGTGSAGNAQDRKGQCTGIAGSSYRRGKNKVQDQQAIRRTGKVKVQNKLGPATGQAKQGTGSLDNVQDKRYRTSITRYRISRQCTGQEGSMYKNSRVQLQERQNKVQDQQAMHRTGRVKVQDKLGPATGQAKQGTGSSDNVQDKRYRTSKTRYRISRQCTGQEGSMYRNSRVQLQERQK